MKRQGTAVLIVGLGLIAATAALLHRLHGMQHVGTPGVRLIAREVRGENGKIIGTNAVDLPARVLDYGSIDIAQPALVLDWLPKDTTVTQRIYTATNHPAMQLTAVVMGTDRTSIHKPEYCLRGQGFNIDKMETGAVVIEQPYRYELPVTRMTCS